VNKQTLVEAIIARLTGELDVYARAARAAHAEATDEESKAENKYDTRGLEASYLARGQSRQLAETEQAINEFCSLPLRRFSEADAVDLGALVELEGNGECSLYFMGPRAGGTEVVHENRAVLVITPQSPLGQQLTGKKQGQPLQLEIGPVRDKYRIVSIA
jgi:hypothetical protein